MFKFLKNIHPKVKAATIGSFAAGVAILALKQFAHVDLNSEQQMASTGGVTAVLGWVWPSTAQ